MSRSLKILQLVHTLDPSVGGVATAVLALSRGLAQHGNKVDIVMLDHPSATWIKDIDLPVHALGSGTTSYRYSSVLMPWLRQNGRGLNS